MKQFVSRSRKPGKPGHIAENRSILSVLLIKRLFCLIRQQWKKSLVGALCLVVLSLLALPSPYFLKLIFDKALVTKNTRYFTFLILLLVGIQLVKLLFTIVSDYYFSSTSQEILAKVKKDLFYRILRLPLSYFDKNQTGYILSRIREVDNLNFFFSSALTRVMISLLEFAFCLTILFHLNSTLTAMSLSLLPLFYFTSRFYSRRTRKLTNEIFERGAILSREVQDSLSGVDVIKYFAAEKREAETINKKLDEFKHLNIRRNILITFSSEMFSLVGAFGGFVILWYSGLDIIKGSFTVGSYMAFAAYVGKLFGPTQMLASIGMTLQPAAVALERITELTELSGEEVSDNGIRLAGLQHKIEFRNVTFSYEDRNALSNVSFEIIKGEIIVFAGPNGSGKSTIIKLLLGLYKPSKGIILIDGYDMNELSLPSVREKISIVSQNTFLFNDTIRNNILYSRPDAKEEEIEEAARLSGAYEFIFALENGFETVIGERGVRLSGGERQKISIARAILKKADIVIFDEATAHLDRESERKLNTLLIQQLRNKTCIIATHKISNISRIDRIYFLNMGEIIDEQKRY